MKRYTLGFIFNTDHSKVLLIHKTKPAWQKGKLNGLGGKLEEGETIQQCIAREVAEESGLKISRTEWVHVGKLHGNDFRVDILTTIFPGTLSEAQTVEDQEVQWCEVQDLPQNIMSNLSWLIPFCIDYLTAKEMEFMEVRFKNNND